MFDVCRHHHHPSFERNDPLIFFKWNYVPYIVKHIRLQFLAMTPFRLQKHTECMRQNNIFKDMNFFEVILFILYKESCKINLLYK